MSRSRELQERLSALAFEQATLTRELQEERKREGQEYWNSVQRCLKGMDEVPFKTLLALCGLGESEHRRNCSDERRDGIYEDDPCVRCLLLELRESREGEFYMPEKFMNRSLTLRPE